MEEAMQAAAVGGSFCAVAIVAAVLALIGSVHWWQRTIAIAGLIASAVILGSVVV
jgi:hypothetical protein